MKIRIENATIVNEGKRFNGTLTLEDDKILGIIPEDDSLHSIPQADQVVDATGMFLLPGVIDDHVHFREAGRRRQAASRPTWTCPT